MVKTPPYQKRGKCGHFMPQFDSHLTCFGCRTKCKGQDPCAKGAKIDQCAACSTLTEEQWIHLRECFSKRSSYCQRSGSQDENLEPETDEEPVFTGEDLGQVDDTLLDLEPEQTGNIAPVTGISPLNNQPSSASLPVMSFPATGPVQQSSDSPALFRAPDPVLTQDTISTGQTPSRYISRTSFTMPQRQRTTTIDIPQTPRTQLLKSHLEQQNFELMHKLQRKNEEQMRDMSTQLQTGLQAFLQQSMENMFNRLAPTPTPAPQASAAQLHIVSITPLSAVPAASKAEEPMDATPSQPPPAIKKGLANVKGSSAIATQSLQAVASHIQVPSAPTQTTTVSPSAQPTVAPLSISSTTCAPGLFKYCQAWI